MFAKNGLPLITWFACLGFLIVSSSCVNAEISPSPTASPPKRLTPYMSPTPSLEPDISTSVVVTPTELPTPTPTPMTYVIVEGDTMLAMALRHGISLAELQAANPEVNARLLSVGTELIIPLGEIIPSSPMTATPIPINLTSTDCHVVPDGVWCFLLVTNARSRELENISARVLLYDGSGELVAEGTAIAALNKLPEDSELPLVVFFPGRFAGEITALTNVLTAQPVPKNDARYLNAWLEIDEVVISEDGLQAEVNGTYGIPAKSVLGNLTWIVVTAYDSEGRVIGVRKLELFGTLEPGVNQNYSLDVFGLGSSIAEVKALVEVRP
jgi:LysM repeat protein